MSKNFFILILLGLLGGIIGGYFFIFLHDKYSADISQSVIQTPVVSDISEQNIWEKSINRSSLSTVGIQVYQANRLIKQGTGIIVSSDGLIVTVSDLAISGAVYQVFYEDKIFRGSVATVDYNHNLLLIKTQNQFSSVADFSSDDYNSGQEMYLVGKFINITKPVVFSQRGTISYITNSSIVIDTVSNINNLSGAASIDQNGNFMGLIFSRAGKINLIKADLIQDFFRKYMTR